MKNTRGLVPVNHFENVGKTTTTRNSAGSGRSLTSTTHDSGYGEGSTPSTQSNQSTAAVRASASASTNGAKPGAPHHRPSKSFGKITGGLFGVVIYDFNAERQDELDAKQGEPILVVAQSSPEWFVAKPISRLGGPGLIPVSFIEIRDVTTGQPADDPLAAVQKAGIPRVEEWKKMAAEYKNTSIPLGTFAQPQEITEGMDRMSLSNGQGHQRQQSTAGQDLPAPVRASVPRYVFQDDKFHFIVECRMSDGLHYDLSRIYEDFYELQINLINAFPEEAGQTGKPRILPYMPGPVKFVTDNISDVRRANLDEYLRDLLRLHRGITASLPVRNFFAPRANDYEVDPAAVDLNEHARPANAGDERYSQASQGSHNTMSHQAAPQSRQMSTATATSSHQYTQSHQSTASFSQPHTHHASQSSSSFAQQPQQPQSQPDAAAQQAPPQQSAVIIPHSTVPVKIKCWFDRDTCVVIRMPPAGQFNLDALWSKVLERRRLEFKDRPQDDEDRLDMEYRDEGSGEYYRIEGEEDFTIAIAAHPDKLTIAVRDPTVEQ
jgi:bud emergence protein 1